MSRKCIECQYACREKECFGSLVREYCTVDNMTLSGNDLYNGRKDCPLEQGKNVSDLVIRGIGLPSGGRRVLVVESTGDVWIPSDYTLTLSYGNNFERLKAIELGPHGDLIDRNELPITGITDYMNEGHTVVELEDVQNAPTIVEASNGKADN